MLLNYQYNEKIPNFFGAHGRRRAGEPLKRQRDASSSSRRCIMVSSKSEIERNVAARSGKKNSFHPKLLRKFDALVLSSLWLHLFAGDNEFRLIKIVRHSCLAKWSLSDSASSHCSSSSSWTATTRGDGQQVFSIIAIVDVVLAVTDARVEHRRIQHISFKLLISNYNKTHIDRTTKIAKSTFAKTGMEWKSKIKIEYSAPVCRPYCAHKFYSCIFFSCCRSRGWRLHYSTKIFQHIFTAGSRHRQRLRCRRPRRRQLLLTPISPFHFKRKNHLV